MIRIILFIITFPINLFACSCGNLWSPITVKDYNDSQFIFSGKAIKVSINDRETVDRQRQIEFQIDEVYKGIIELKNVIVYTALSDASCGLNIQANEEWVIWGYLQDSLISTNLCTRSKLKNNISSYDLKSLKYFKSNPTTSEWKNEFGNLIAEGKLINNMPNGHWKYFYKNGYTESEGIYLNGFYHGKWTKYLDPEGIVTRLRYDNKIPNDSIPNLEQFKNKVWEIQNYKNGIREGEFIRYAYNSFDKPTNITNFKNGQYDGKSIAYFTNGIIYYEQNYKDGKLEGYERFYYPSGQLKQEGKFIQSKPIGTFKLYSETGELLKTSIDKRPD